MEILICFTKEYSKEAKLIYDNLIKENFNIFLYSVTDIICTYKLDDKYDVYILLGNDCLEHKQIENKVIYKLYNIKVEDDEIYKVTCNINDFSTKIINDLFKNEEYSCKYEYEKITEMTIINRYKRYLEPTNQFLMKENIKGKYFKTQNIFAVIYTSKRYEKIADETVSLIKKYKNSVYKLYLKDVSYERLISIDSLDCIVLIDCQMFEFDINLHIPVISVFSLCRGIDNQWTDVYNRNEIRIIKSDHIDEDEHTTEIVSYSTVAKIMVNREFNGVKFKDDEKDDTIYEGRKGIANDYEGI